MEIYSSSFSPFWWYLGRNNVKSAKQHLRRVIGISLLTFKELTTVLSQIEACLNSRPLYPLSADPNDLAALTPGHFLIGEPLISISDPSLLEVNTNRLSRWQNAQQIVQRVWKRWHREYLTQLQQRFKWKTSSPNLEVLVKEDNTPPLLWVKGRVVETHPGEDGRVRVVTLKTQSGLIKRAISKLCKLPAPPC